MAPRNTNDRKYQTERATADWRRRSIPLLIFLAFLAPGCTKPFDVNVSTAEPVKVEMSMDVHVYQHGDKDEEARAAQKNYKDVMTRRRNRMGEIRELKDNRLVGESAEGLLSIRNLPAGEYGDYVKKTVAEENEDRNFLMQYEAEQKDKPVAEVRREQWRHAQRKSFPGEWIQVEDTDEPGTFRWIQKTGSSEE
ncbi:MAG: DUF1318 domain-containing protein [Verrucomicrobiales bacterium]|nr:DUF1318 domain-containing protein [Verrucomicrobiales bacterium]